MALSLLKPHFACVATVTASADGFGDIVPMTNAIKKAAEDTKRSFEFRLMHQG